MSKQRDTTNVLEHGKISFLSIILNIKASSAYLLASSINHSKALGDPISTCKARGLRHSSITNSLLTFGFFNFFLLNKSNKNIKRYGLSLVCFLPFSSANLYVNRYTSKNLTACPLSPICKESRDGTPSP